MKKRVLILSNHFITLYNFRKELIARLIDEGYEVSLSLPPSERNDYFRRIGCKIVHTAVDRRGVNPFRDIALLMEYLKIMRTCRPDIILSFTVKPNIYGSLASNLLGLKQACNITGTGATFLRGGVISNLVKTLYKISVRNAHTVFFQNTGDRDYFMKHNMVGTKHVVLPGSGVNLLQYSFCEMPTDSDGTNFIYMGRVMAIKGIDQLLLAAEIIKSKFPSSRFYVAGYIEEEEYRSTIMNAHSNGLIEYIGFQQDIKPWIEKCHCVILPSHGGEGVPNVLLEAAAMGRACIASNISGCQGVVDNGVNGYLFQAGDAIDLTAKVETFIRQAYYQKATMGRAGRAKVEKDFDRSIVVAAYLDEIKRAVS